MKKTILLALVLFVAFAFTACENTDPTREEQRTEWLTQSKGWTLASATSIPPYENTAGEEDEDLFVSYFEECEVDDILYFDANKGSRLKSKCENKEIPLGGWSFLEDCEVLEFFLPYFVDNDDKMKRLEGKISHIDDGMLTLRIPIKFASTPAKGKKRVVAADNAKGDNYDFILTYKKAK